MKEIWDNHACMSLTNPEKFMPQLERYRSAGVSVVSLNVGYADMSWMEHIRVLSIMRRWIAGRPDSYCLVRTAEDAQRCRSEGKLGVVFDVEGMCPVQNELGLVQTFYELGVRWMLIAYNRNNAAGGGCMDCDCGLTDLGRMIIDEMERVGMVLCLSHAGSRTAAEALEYSRRPAIFSHSNPYGDTRHARNVSDELMQACAAKGGVVGLSGLGPFLGTDRKLVERLLHQLRYVIDRIGVDHVGLGLDCFFDRGEAAEAVRLNPHLFPAEAQLTGDIALIEPESFGAIVEGLARDNLTEAQVWAVMGGNWLRIAAEVWR